MWAGCRREGGSRRAELCHEVKTFGKGFFLYTFGGRKVLHEGRGGRTFSARDGIYMQGGISVGALHGIGYALNERSPNMVLGIQLQWFFHRLQAFKAVMSSVYQPFHLSFPFLLVLALADLLILALLLRLRLLFTPILALLVFFP